MRNQKIAVIGYASRLPQTSDATFWEDLLARRDLVTRVAEDRWATANLEHPQRTHPGTSVTFAAGSLGDVAGFDAGFFRISPREATTMDPQQRLLLEMSWEAFAHAGIAPSSLRGSRCGVFMGLASTDYAYRLADDLAAIGSNSATGSTASIAANRLSYFYDLRGPSLVVDTACSSALVAFHQACQSLLRGESELALTGAISLHLHPYGFLIFSRASMLSASGRCRPFDAAADGYARAEGGGVFVLKGYDKALRDGDRILAVVTHTAINTDGHKGGLTIPNVDAQAQLLEEAYAAAGIHPEAIDYVEAHGTGTTVGDPIEVAAIGRALGRHRDPRHPLPVGSVKSNLGHLETASGVPSLIKAIHCLQKRRVPATIGVERLNPRLELTENRLEVVTENLALKGEGRLVIGVNSFGFGGANAHVILESAESVQAEEDTPAPDAPRPLPLVLTAATPAALQQVAGDLARVLAAQPETSWYATLYQATFRRDWLRHRAIFWHEGHHGLVDHLAAFAAHDDKSGGIVMDTALADPQGPVFAYSGNGCQWFGMGRSLLSEPIFRQAIEEIDAFFFPLAGYRLVDDLAGSLGEDRYALTGHAQPALFALQVGITQMLRSWEVRPVAVTGHSVGEVAAAWACGALDLEDAVRVIFHRSRLQEQSRGQGQMTAVALAADATRKLLREWDLAEVLHIAAWNSPRGATVVGPTVALSEMEARLRAQGTACKRLDIEYPFHSPVMENVREELFGALSGLRPGRAHIPFYSSVSGASLPGETLTADYWWANIRDPIRFQQATEQMLAGGFNVFVELGGHPVLRGYLQDGLTQGEREGRIIATLRRGDDHPQRILAAVQQVFITGVPVEWPRFYPKPGPFVDLPHYPWERERYWHPVTAESAGTLYRYPVHPLLGHPVPQHDHEWEQDIDTARLPFLADHRVGEGVIFPGAGYVELFLAAARQRGDESALLVLEDLEIWAPLSLNEESGKVLRVTLDAASGEVQALSRDRLAQDWTLHAKARIVAERTDLRLRRPAMERPEGAPDFDGEQHYRLAESVGLLYGPNFRTVTQGWVRGDAVWAAMALPSDIAAFESGFHLHPALLDGAFQLVIDLLRDNIVDHPGVAFVPIRMGRITLRQPLTQVAWAGARLLRRSPQSILAEFTLMDAAGTVVALCEGVRMRQVKLLRTPDEPLRLIGTELVAMPRREALQKAPPLPVAALAEALQAALGRGDVQHALGRYRDEYAPLLDALLQAFLRESWGEAVAETMPAFADEEPISAGQIWVTLIRDYPEFSALTLQVGRAGMALAASSANDGDDDRAAAPPLDPDLWVRTILQTIDGPIHAAVTRFMQERCAQLAPSSRLGIMEINAHGPDWIVQVAEALSGENRCDLYYAGPGAEILESQAEMAREAQWQSLAIPAAGTLSAPDPRPTVHFAWMQVDGDADTTAQMIHMAQDCLAPQGLLFLLGVHPEPWMSALAECRDADAGQSLTEAQLQANLQQMGFVDARSLDQDNALRTGPYLLLARKSEDALPTAQTEPGGKGRWLLVGDKACGDDHQSPWMAALKWGFAQQGFRTITLEAASVQELEDSLRVLFREEVGAWEGVLYFPGLFPAPDEMSVGRLLGEQCQSLRTLSQWALGQEEPPPVWVLTRHGLSTLYPSPLPPAMTDGMVQPLHGAGLTGFARTLQNELPELALRVLDLTESGPTPPLLEHLVRECVCPDSETEIVLDGHGGRYAPRVREKPALEITTRAPRQLRFAAPGQLRNLHWARFNPPDLAEDDVEVLVGATGLNFRDVMYALGMLSDEALENGFSGPGLGLEFAGTVGRVGKGVSHVAPGDRVVGFAPASFATHVVTKGYAVTRLPEHLGVEAAATIPTAFLTAWYALMELARLQPGERVLVHGGAGGVGIAAIQMAQWRGAEVYATVGSPEKRDFLRLLGVSHLYHSRSYDFAEEIWRDTNQEGVDVVLNSLSGEAIRRNLQILRPFGRFLELGKRDFYENTAMALRPFRNNLSYFGIDADQLMQLRPTLTQEMFGRVMERFAAGDFFPLPYTCFPARSVVPAFRHMQQARQIGKIVVTMEEPLLPVVNDNRLRGEPLQLAADGVYLVTGGLSGFGLETARRLAERGARKLVLISRSGRMDGHAQEAMTLMRSWGVEILALRCDVTDPTQLADLFARIALELGSLRGVIHAAAVIDDALAQNLSEEQIQRVLAPKVQGALHLHHLTQTLPLDFFVLYSSVTTILGNPGQAHYVAANTWMEALARQRRAQGLPATAILWGAIGDVGFLARNNKTKEALQQRLGSAPMSSRAALDWLEEILARDVSGDAVVDWDWRAIRRFLPIAQSPKFSPWNLDMGHDESADSTDEDLCGYLLSLPDDEAVSAITDLLRREVAEILRLPMEKIEAAQSLSQIGLDSLMGVELALALEQRLGVKLPSLLLAEGPTPARLADRVLQELRKRQGSGEDPQVAAMDEEDVRRLAGLHGVEAQAPALDGWVMNGEGR